ncbi:MAG: GIY-YIG nuclease family protein [Pseudomonadota bacterium]
MDKLKKAELKLAYKMALPPHGLYAIRNLATGACYVDASTNLSGAMNRHKFDLVRGNHRCKALQQDWTHYGEAGFVMEVLQQLQPRPEPDFDYVAELATMLKAWRENSAAGIAHLYNPPALK